VRGVSPEATTDDDTAESDSGGSDEYTVVDDDNLDDGGSGSGGEEEDDGSGSGDDEGSGSGDYDYDDATDSVAQAADFVMESQDGLTDVALRVEHMGAGGVRLSCTFRTSNDDLFAGSLLHSSIIS